MELRASQLLSRQAYATRTQSDTQNLPEGSAGRPVTGRAKRVKRQGLTAPAPSRPLLRLHLNGSDKHETAQSYEVSRGSIGRERKSEVRGPRVEIR